MIGETLEQRYMGMSSDVKKITLDNTYFHQVITSSPTVQLVVTSLRPRENIGFEIHPYAIQFIRVDASTGKARIDERVLFIPPNT